MYLLFQLIAPLTDELTGHANNHNRIKIHKHIIVLYILKYL